MKRGRNDSKQYAVTLFPFLAVLICTMGILVVLLVVAVQAADVDAREKVQASRSEYQSKIDAVQDSIDTEAFRVSGLTEFRPDLVKRLQDARARRAHVQLALDNLDEKAKQLALRKSKLERPPENSQQSLSQLEAEAALIAEQIAHASSQLLELKDAKPVETTTYSIVPTDTGSSTLRRPIYIECVNDKLILRPHQITLAASDFQQPIFAGNPLDAALIAIRDYWQRFDLTGDEGAPYPLLVVRPSGARAYALARHAMQSWQDEFGYELIEEDLPLEFGELDTQLQNEINLAVAKAKQRRANSTHADEFGIPRLGDSTVDSRGNSAADRRQSGGASGRYTGLTVDNENGGFTLEGSTSQQSDFAAYRNSGRNSDHNSDRNAYSGRSPEDDFEPFPTDEEFAAGGVSDSGNWQTRNQSRQGNTESANRSRGADQESATSGVAGGSAAGNSLDSLAESRGANWALPSRTERGTVYRRPITVYCAANELVVESGTGLDDRRKVVRFDGLTPNAVAPLVAEVWEKIDSWGFAGTGGYWKPELKLNVLPGGLHRANDLRVLLDDSGLDIDVIEN